MQHLPLFPTVPRPVSYTHLDVYKRQVSIFDYVVGAVAAEMPMSYSDEALKAQAVAAHSYALARKALARQTQTSAPMGAYFSANPSSRLGYVTDDVMKQMWGDAYAENRARLVGLVQPVLGEVLTYDGQPALACYHAISNGATPVSYTHLDVYKRQPSP